MDIQWFPGHMKKAQNLILEYKDKVDVFLEVLDARAPWATKNPLLDKLIQGKPRLVLLNKMDLADPQVNLKWKAYFDTQEDHRALLISSKEKKNVKAIPQACADLCRGKKWFGMRKIRGMIVGIPNCGKSTLINALAGGRKASVANKPGHTKSVQRIQAGDNFDLLDTPGILWHKFDDPQVALHLAFLGAIKDQVVEIYELTLKVWDFLNQNYPGALQAKYKIEGGAHGEEFIEQLCRRRGYLLRGQDLDWERACTAILSDFRQGLLGSFSLERPPESSADPRDLASNP